MPRLCSVGDWLADRYEIVEVFQGGMGVVYAARDHRASGRDWPILGLKTLKDEFLSDRVRNARFLTEGRLWAGLEAHPNVVRAEGIESIDGKPFIRMEWVSGGDLRSWIGSPRLDVLRVLRFGVQFCLGMEHAQRGGVRCHRDVKPANLLVDSEGVLKIADFGIARLRDDFTPMALAAREGPIPLAETIASPPIIWTDAPDRLARAPIPEIDSGVAFEQSEPNLSATTTPASRVRDPLPHTPTPAETAAPHDHAPDSTIHWPGPVPLEMLRQTVTGALLGTLPYMAPEQFRDSNAVDIRTDIYAFGIVLYEMLAGKRPFVGTSLHQLRYAHEQFRPRPLEPVIPRRWRRCAGAIDGVVQRCLNKNPDSRYQSVTALRTDLTHLLRKLGP